MDTNTKYPITNICSNRVLVDYRTSEESVQELIKLGIDVYKSTRVESLYEEVTGHPDMQIYFINKKNINNQTGDTNGWTLPI